MKVSRFLDMIGGLLDMSPGLVKKLGGIESLWLQDKISKLTIDKPIYIAGLARSGTTILLESIAIHPDIASHTYRDFPLVHIPVWWNWFLDHAVKHENTVAERAHKDGIFVTPKSPEAMEEVIWMSFFDFCHDSSVNNVISPGEVNKDFQEYYLNHIKKVLFLRGGNRYLAKGNYNITRLEYIHELFPDARFVVPVRAPIEHVASLQKQHQLFSYSEKNNKRVLNYMRRSGHFEFGLDRRAINFGNDNAVKRIEKLWEEGEEVRGLAAYWASVYGYLANLLESNEELADCTLIVHYDDLCKQPVKMLEKVYMNCALDISQDELQSYASKITAPSYYEHKFTSNELACIEEETKNAQAQINKFRVL